MPSTRRTRARVALISFAAAAMAGWFIAGRPEAAKQRVIPVVPDKTPLLPAVPQPSPVNSPGGTIAAMERSLAALLDPAAEVYTGERLLELCQRDFPRDLPGSTEFFSYARRWSQHAPQEMFEWFLHRGAFTLPGREGNYGFLNSLFFEWARRDSTAALAAALRCGQKRDRAEAVMTVVASLTKTDPARATSIAAENMALFSDGGTHAFSAYGEDYRDTWSFLTSLPAGKDRGEVLARFFDDVTRYHGADCARLWKEMPDAARRDIVAGGFTGIHLGDAESSPGSPAALDGLEDLRRQFVESSGEAKAARVFLNTSGREWAARDPAAAIGWAQQHLKGELRVAGTAQLFQAGAAQDFDATLRTWQSLPDGILRARAAGNMAAAAPNERKDDIEALLAGLSPADQRIAEEARKAAAVEQRTRDLMEQMRESNRKTVR